MVARKTEPAPRRLAPVKPYPHERIRIGYMSSDYCSHAMSYLITELFEHHDRRRFEVFGYVPAGMMALNCESGSLPPSTIAVSFARSRTSRQRRSFETTRSMC